MNHFVSKLQNFWFYYKKHLTIGVTVLAICCYLTVQTVTADKPDYHIGLVQAVPCSEEELSHLQSVLVAAGEDVNGDGQVLVKIHTYFVDLADDSPNAGVANSQTVSALDADLIGNQSGIFLLEDVPTFMRVTDGILSPVISAIPSLDQELFLGLRKDAEDAYVTLAENLLS